MKKLFLLFFTIFCGAHVFAQHKPNIIFIVTDDQRFNTIHALGNNEISTPNMDKLVRSGISYTQATYMGGMGGAVCAPSRAMMMTGRYLFSLPTKGAGVNISEQDTTLPTLLKQNGYTTFETGKWHNDRKAFARSFDSCADAFFGGMLANQRNPELWDYDSTGKYLTAKINKENKFSSEYFADAAVGYIQSRKEKKDKPYFCYIAFTAPHDPRTPPEEFITLYQSRKPSVPPNYLPQHPFDNGDLKIRDELLVPVPRTKEVVQEELTKYYAMISDVDNQIGRIINAVEAAGELNNTVFILVGDNGLSIGSQGLLGKQNLYEESIRIPLIIAGPGIPANQKRDALVYLADIYPTICDYLHITQPVSVAAKSFARSFVVNKRYSAYTVQYFAYENIQRALRTKDGWKYIRYYVNKTVTEQLFNLNKDPFEINNLVANRAYQKELQKLRKIMVRESKSYRDDALIVNAVK